MPVRMKTQVTTKGREKKIDSVGENFFNKLKNLNSNKQIVKYREKTN